MEIKQQQSYHALRDHWILLGVHPSSYVGSKRIIPSYVCVRIIIYIYMCNIPSYHYIYNIHMYVDRFYTGYKSLWNWNLHKTYFVATCKKPYNDIIWHAHIFAWWVLRTPQGWWNAWPKKLWSHPIPSHSWQAGLSTFSAGQVHLRRRLWFQPPRRSRHRGNTGETSGVALDSGGHFLRIPARKCGLTWFEWSTSKSWK